MRFKDISIKSMHPFVSAHLDFSKLPEGGVIAIVGPNGAGKSTFVELLDALMYRKTPTHGLLKDLARGRDSCLQGTVVNGAAYNITHTVDSHTGKSEAIVKGEDGKPLWGDTKTSSFDAWADQHFLPEEVYEAGPFAVQEAPGLCKMRASDRMDVLLRAIGCEHLEAKAKRCRENAATTSQRLDTVAARIADETARGGDLDAAQANLDAATAEAARADSAVAECRQQLTEADETIATLKAETARLASEAESLGVAAKEHERAAAEASARRESALAGAEKVRADLGLKLRDARARVDKTHQAIANNRKVLADREQINAAVSRAAELDAEISEQKQSLTETRAKAGQWATTAQACERDMRAATARIRAADDRATKAQATLRRRKEIEAAVAAAAEASAKLPDLMTKLDAARAALEALHSKGLVSAEQRISALRGALLEIGNYFYDDAERSRAIALGAISTDDAAVATAKAHPAAVKTAQMRVAFAESAYMTAKQDKSHNDPIAALAPTIAAAQADFDAAEIESLAAQSEEQQATIDAEAARKSERSMLASATGIETATKAREAERASLATLLQFRDRLTTAEARIQELEGILADQAATVRDLQIEIEALPPEPPEAVQAGKEAAAALERARVAREAMASINAALKSDRLYEAEQTRKGLVAESDVLTTTARHAASSVTVAQGKVELARASAGALETLKAERAAVEADLADWNLLADTLGRAGLQAAEVDCAGPALTELTNDLLHNCVNNRWTATWTTTKLVDKGKREASECNITVLDTEEGREAPANEYSPGQRALFELAASLALTMYSCNRLGLEKPLLVRDESSSGLDPSMGQAYVSMVRRAANQIGADRTLFISHNPQMWDLADAKILIENGTVRIG